MPSPPKRAPPAPLCPVPVTPPSEREAELSGPEEDAAGLVLDESIGPALGARADLSIAAVPGPRGREAPEDSFDLLKAVAAAGALPEDEVGLQRHEAELRAFLEASGLSQSNMLLRRGLAHVLWALEDTEAELSMPAEGLLRYYLEACFELFSPGESSGPCQLGAAPQPSEPDASASAPRGVSVDELFRPSTPSFGGLRAGLPAGEAEERPAVNLAARCGFRPISPDWWLECIDGAVPCELAPCGTGPAAHVLRVGRNVQGDDFWKQLVRVSEAVPGEMHFEVRAMSPGGGAAVGWRRSDLSFILTDLSGGGTFLNGAGLDGDVALQPGDVIGVAAPSQAVAALHFRFEAACAERAPAVAPPAAAAAAASPRGPGPRLADAVLEILGDEGLHEDDAPSPVPLAVAGEGHCQPAVEGQGPVSPGSDAGPMAGATVPEQQGGEAQPSSLADAAAPIERASSPGLGTPTGQGAGGCEGAAGPAVPEARTTQVAEEAERPQEEACGQGRAGPPEATDEFVVRVAPGETQAAQQEQGSTSAQSPGLTAPEEPFPEGSTGAACEGHAAAIAVAAQARALRMLSCDSEPPLRIAIGELPPPFSLECVGVRGLSVPALRGLPREQRVLDASCLQAELRVGLALQPPAFWATLVPGGEEALRGLLDPEHFEVCMGPEGSGLLLRSLNAAGAGTLLNGVCVRGSAEVQPGDVISIGIGADGTTPALSFCLVTCTCELDESSIWPKASSAPKEALALPPAGPGRPNPMLEDLLEVRAAGPGSLAVLESRVAPLVAHQCATLVCAIS